jgi:hypothetical protein
MDKLMKLLLFTNAIAFLEHLLFLDWVRSPNHNQTPFLETQS